MSNSSGHTSVVVEGTTEGVDCIRLLNEEVTELLRQSNSLLTSENALQKQIQTAMSRADSAATAGRAAKDIFHRSNVTAAPAGGLSAPVKEWSPQKLLASIEKTLSELPELVKQAERVDTLSRRLTANCAYPAYVEWVSRVRPEVPMLVDALTRSPADSGSVATVCTRLEKEWESVLSRLDTELTGVRQQTVDWEKQIGGHDRQRRLESEQKAASLKSSVSTLWRHAPAHLMLSYGVGVIALCGGEHSADKYMFGLVTMGVWLLGMIIYSVANLSQAAEALKLVPDDFGSGQLAAANARLMTLRTYSDELNRVV